MTGNATSSFWDATCDAQGHTGWADALVYAYDQPLRLRAVSRLLDELFPDGLAGRRALDIGCGTGDIIALAAGRGARVVGLDLSPVVVERTRTRFGDRSDVTVQAGSVTETRFAPGCFDLVTSVTVLQHVTEEAELRATLLGLRRALVDGGFLVMLELAPPIDVTVRHPGFPVVERSAGVWKDLLEQAGFAIEKEGRYPQTGITLIRGAARVLDALRPGSAEAGSAPLPGAEGAGPGSGARRVLRAGWWFARRSLLAAARPADHWLWAPTPARWQYYRLLAARAAGRPEGAD